MSSRHVRNLRYIGETIELWGRWQHPFRAASCSEGEIEAVGFAAMEGFEHGVEGFAEKEGEAGGGLGAVGEIVRDLHGNGAGVQKGLVVGEGGGAHGDRLALGIVGELEAHGPVAALVGFAIEQADRGSARVLVGLALDFPGHPGNVRKEHGAINHGILRVFRHVGDTQGGTRELP